MNKDSEDQQIITLGLIIGSSLSIIGCIFIISVYYALKMDIFAYRLVVYIAVADLIHSICLMLPVSDPWCHIQAFLLEYSSLSSILWTALMAYSLHESVINLNHDIQSNEKKYLVIGFVLPLIVSALPEISQTYGYSQGWCWIVDPDYYYLYRVFCFYFFLVLVFIFNCIVYIKVWKKVHRELLESFHDEEINRTNEDMMTRLKMYPIILFICYSGVATKRLLEIFCPEKLETWVIFTAGVLMAIVGFLDALVYGLSLEVRVNLARVCRGKGREEKGLIN